MDASSRELLDEHFPDGPPSVLLRVAFERGYGPTLMPLVERIFLSGTFGLPPVITEAVQVLAHSTCRNKYCAVFHACGLVRLGFDVDQVQALVERQALPASFADRERWEPTLRRVATLFATPELAGPMYAQLGERHAGQELEELGALLAFCSLDRFVLEFHSGEVDVREEPIVFEMVAEAPELITYFMREDDRQVAIYSICCRCKDVLTTDGWAPVEQALSAIPPDARFSHAYCPACVDRELARFEA